MKIQLCSVFAITLTMCLFILPTYAVMEYWRYMCWKMDKTIAVIGFTTYSTFGIVERNLFTVIAVYRMAAVCFPIRYKQWSQLRGVVAVIALVSLVVVTLWITAICKQDFNKVDVNDPSTYGMGKVLLYFFLATPIIVTVATYVIMILFIRYKGQRSQRSQRPMSKDQVLLSLGALILTNVLLDVPHIIMHFARVSSTELPFIVLHVIYRAHYAVDPFIFVGLNPHYRQKVLRRVSCWGAPGGNDTSLGPGTTNASIPREAFRVGSFLGESSNRAMEVSQLG
ncbi:uncharacterized protein LOC122245411 [Penaeus japonicus]|uniref:uncharacterized protein LOC122245411 n=1 Tax=Penaeus japonicus TaxID=27405 RepID=UPI001C715021|nr:uncharacterized protein LOC122245411 [Penaeus japonicus]